MDGCTCMFKITKNNPINLTLTSLFCLTNFKFIMYLKLNKLSIQTKSS